MSEVPSLESNSSSVEYLNEAMDKVDKSLNVEEISQNVLSVKYESVEDITVDVES